MRTAWIIICGAVALGTPAVSSAQFHSKTFIATGFCDGLDQVPILERPWEKVPIIIVGAAVGLMLDSPSPNAYAFAGNSYVPDVMALRIGAGSETVMYPADHGFALPAGGSVNPPH